MDTIFKVKNLCKDYTLKGETIHVLQNLSFEVERGKWIALVGPSGSGKTTLLQLLGGLLKPTSGEIWLENTNIAALGGARLTELRRRKIGFIFQSYHLIPELSALENVALPGLQWFTDRKKVYDTAERYLDAFGLSKRSRHLPPELSGGEQQRVAIARALINDPQIILADEPTGNLDAAAAHQIVDILTTLQKEENRTMLMVTHDQRLAEQADGIVPLK